MCFQHGTHIGNLLFDGHLNNSRKHFTELRKWNSTTLHFNGIDYWTVLFVTTKKQVKEVADYKKKQVLKNATKQQNGNQTTVIIKL